MSNRLLGQQANPKTFGISHILLVIVLAAAGYLIGSRVNSLQVTGAMPATTDTTKPAGGARVEPPPLLHDFTLTSQEGKPISLSDLRGRAVLMFFGYTHCPDVCPTTLADYTRVKQALGRDAENVAFVFISVDGTRDTPDALAAYLGQFDSGLIGMTGDAAALRRVGAEYGLLFQRQTISASHTHDEEHDHQEGQALDTENYFVQHTSPSFLIDPDGYLRMVYFYGTEPSVIAEGIREILW